MTSLNYSFSLNLHIYSLYSLYILYWYILFFKSEQNLKTTKSRSLLFWDYVWQKHHKIEKRLAFCTLDNYCLFYNINEDAASKMRCIYNISTHFRYIKRRPMTHKKYLNLKENSILYI